MQDLEVWKSYFYLLKIQSESRTSLRVQKLDLYFVWTRSLKSPVHSWHDKVLTLAYINIFILICMMMSETQLAFLEPAGDSIFS